MGMAAMLAAFGMFAFASQAFAATSVESVKLTGPNIITVVYSEPVYTSPSDYFDFTGSFAGNSVTSVSGSGSNTVTLTLSNSETSGATGYLTIGTNVQDVSDQQYFGGATWNIVSSIGPAITSFGVSSNDENGSFVGTNDTLTVTFNTNEQVNVLNMTIDGHSVSVGGGGTGPYTASYTMLSTDSTQSVPITFTIEDNDNNQSSISLSYNGNGIASTNTGSAAISSITSNANTAGVLVIGDSITFTLTPATAEPNARVTGSYNGAPLSWATTNNGLNYVATYVVSSGQSSQQVPLQISGVTLTDQYGNTSVPASGGDIEKTINTGTTTATTIVTDSSSTTELQSLESEVAALQAEVSGGSATSKAAGYNFTEFLTIGSENAQVTALQERLSADGFFTGAVTDYYGSLTQAAVEKFQAAHNIDVYGYVGPATRAALNAGE